MSSREDPGPAGEMHVVGDKCLTLSGWSGAPTLTAFQEREVSNGYQLPVWVFLQHYYVAK